MVAFLLAIYNQLQNCWFATLQLSCEVWFALSPQAMLTCSFGLLLLGLFFLLAENCYLNENCTNAGLSDFKLPGNYNKEVGNQTISFGSIFLLFSNKSSRGPLS